MDAAFEAPPETIRRRIAALRERLRTQGLHGWIALTSDPHLSEYLPAHWQGRSWLSGFCGSAGTLVVTADFAGLWADSRYWVEAQTRLQGTGIETVQSSSAAGPDLMAWLTHNTPSGAEVGVDGTSLGLALARSLEAALRKAGARLRTSDDILDALWTDRPALPAAPVVERDESFESLRRGEKLARVRAAMADAGAQWHWISSLDDIAWLLNLRGADVPYNPVFLAHALIGMDTVRLFVAPGKIPAALAQRLAGDGIVLEDYTQARAALAALPADGAVLVDPRRVAHATVAAVPGTMRVVEQINPTVLFKSRKSAAELAHVRAAMRADGAALCEFFCWLEQALARRATITELTIDAQVCAARARRPGFVSPSFGTIAAFNANGAAPHYSASAAAHATICSAAGCGNGLLLIDSGGQYTGGTTDITRVVAIGSVTPEQRRDCTLVLKGMIALSVARFPRGTRAPLLDALARAPIWSAGIDYGHGTGHGVGYFLNVHEGPQGISPHLPPEAHTALEAGMITSNEPGIYRPGRWGVRIENLLATVPAEEGEFGAFLAFETLTQCPIDTRCIEVALLRADERAWLNDYHANVRACLAPLLAGAPLDWLQRATAPV